MFNKHTINISLLLLAMIYGTNSFAAGARLAFIDMRKAILESATKKKADERLNKEFGKQESQIKADSKKLKELAEKVKKSGRKNIDDSTFKAQQTFVKLRRKLLREKQSFTRRLKKRQLEEKKKINKKVMGAIASVAKKGNYDVVLVNKGIIYKSASADITDKVKALMDK